MRQSFLTGSIVLFVVLFSYPYCCYPKDIRGISEKEIKIGVIYDQTGPATTVTLMATEAFKNYFRWINDQGGIHGRKIRLIIEDDRYQVPATIAAFKKLVSKDMVFAILGPGSSHGYLAIRSRIMKEKVPTLMPPTSDRVVVPAQHYIFANGPTYEDQMKTAFQYIVRDLKMDKPRIVFIRADNERGRIGLNAARKSAKRFGFELVSEEVLNPTSIASTAEVMKMKMKKPDFVVLNIMVPNLFGLMRAAKKMGLAAWFVGEHYLTSAGLVEKMGDVGSQYIGGGICSPWYHDSSGMDRLRSITLKYRPGTEKPFRNSCYTQGFCDATIFVEGLKKAGKDMDAEAFVKALESFQEFDMEDMCGNITFTPENHKGSRYLRMYKVDVREKRLIPISDWMKPEF
ncbi:MAG: ABC transporter substrate-binding protein [Thermodesulfobacteriota bacterium]|nr:ABC transporter substrate-binding protein [Thermodesulfobacteriota bacterium]